MDVLQFLEAAGLDLPTPAYVVGMILFGIVGLVGWTHGRRRQRRTAKWLGLGLMLYPYAVPQTWLLYLVGAVLSAWLAWEWN